MQIYKKDGIRQKIFDKLIYNFSCSSDVKQYISNICFQIVGLSGGKSLILLQFYKTYSIISWIGYKIYYLMKTP